MAFNTPLNHALFWSDSSDFGVWWLRTPSRRFKPSVANRVDEIQASTNSEQWRYILTDENPADFSTRSMTATELANSETWWQGPKFQKEAEPEWLENPIKQPSSGPREIRTRGRFSKAEIQSSQETTLIAVTEERPLDWYLDSRRFSSWTRLARIHPWVSRILRNCCLPKAQRTAGEINLEEIKASAEAEIIGQAQREASPEKYRVIRPKEKNFHSQANCSNLGQ